MGVLDFIFNYFQLISYNKSDKNSGTYVKNKILEIIDSGDTVLIFPEGKTTRDGKPQDFRNGIFELCAKNNISIIPITIRYNKDIGMDETHFLDFKEWFNVTCNVYIHPLISNNDMFELKKQTFDAITSK